MSLLAVQGVTVAGMTFEQARPQKDMPTCVVCQRVTHILPPPPRRRSR
jgi:hypothetical protein